jgi:hypothetical protein
MTSSQVTLKVASLLPLVLLLLMCGISPSSALSTNDTNTQHSPSVHSNPANDITASSSLSLLLSSVLSANDTTTQLSPSTLSVHSISTPLHSGHGHDAPSTECVISTLTANDTTAQHSPSNLSLRRSSSPLHSGDVDRCPATKPASFATDHELWSSHSSSSRLSPFSSSQQSSSTTPASAFRICHSRDDWGLMYLPRKRLQRQPFRLDPRALLRYACFTCVHWLVRALCSVPRLVCAATQKFAEYECPLDKSMTLLVAGAFVFCSLWTRRRPVRVSTHIAKVAAAVCCMWLPFMDGAQLVMVGAALVAWRRQRVSYDPELVWLMVVCSPSSSSVFTPPSGSVDTPAKHSDRQQTSPDTELVWLTVVCSPSRSSVVTPPSVATPAKHSGCQPDTEDRYSIFILSARNNGVSTTIDVCSSDTLDSVLKKLQVRT